MFLRSSVIVIFACWIITGGELLAQNTETRGVFARSNLMAWCIVPFDSEKRTPEQRAEMLQELGIHKLAYDYRAEHVPLFDEEIEQLQEHGVELYAWWFPSVLNDEARLILEKLKKHKVQPQLWVTGGGTNIAAGNIDEQRRRVLQEADRIRPIAEAAAEIGCSVGLYNHGGWFGDPANQLEIIDELGRSNVGIVYNLHHGHDHLERFAELLQRMKPHLMALNLNGMEPNGDQAGQKILPLGAGSLDLDLLRIIDDSGYKGPIGILNHTDEDARARLMDNLDGLDWLTKQLEGKPAGPKPKYRSWKPSPPTNVNTGKPALDGGKLFASDPRFRTLPLTVVCKAKLTQQAEYNILVANDTKASGEHWELFTQAGSGQFSAYLPGYRPDHVRSTVNVCDSAPHHLAMVFEPTRVRLFVDAQLVADQAVERTPMSAVPGAFAIGRLVEDSFRCFGEIHSVQVFPGVVDVSKPESSSNRTWQFSREGVDADPNPSTGASTLPAVSPAVDAAPFDPQLVHSLAEDIANGNAARGVEIFASATSACLSCHRIGQFGGTVGPDLSAIGTQRSAEHLIESLLWPNRHVESKFQVTQILNVDGEQLRGYVVREDNQGITLQDPSSDRVVTIQVEDIELRKLGPSLMPEGLVNGWTRGQQLDLIAFLSDLGRNERLRPEIAASVLEHSQAHAPTPFPFERAPIDPSASPHWEAFVNRDRIYDFYKKQAMHFRTKDSEAQLLMEFPGLDGGPSADALIGHWGNQDEQTWASNDWNEAELAGIQSGAFRGENGLTVARGVCLQLGDERELSVCFDPMTMSYPAMWTGGFLEFSTVRHGFIHGLRAKGQFIPVDNAAGPIAATLAGATSSDNSELPANQTSAIEQFDYLGFYRVGNRVVFSFRVGDIEYLDAPWVIDGKFTREVGPRATHSFRDLLLEIPKQAPVSIETSLTLGTQTPYAIDTIELPLDNPWNIPLYCSGLDFLADGSALVATMQGDVWHVDGFSSESERDGKPIWRRFATGLHQPLGLKVDEDGVFVLCRDQLMRLHDINNDGEADYHECFSNAFQTSAAGHDYICGLQRDSKGNFYTASGNQGLVRIAANGRTAEVIAAGFRNPDGLGMMPSGVITLPCSEGEWTPASMICAVRPGEQAIGNGTDGELGIPFYGYRGAQFASLPIERPHLPLMYLPRGLDNSSGGQVFIDSDRWGPLKGKMVHLSFGSGKHFLLLQDEVDGQLQGAVVPLPGEFQSGVHRGRFSPKDGQLYVCGMAGWGSYTPQVGCFQRVRWTGEQVQVPVGFHLHENGVAIQFAERLTSTVCRQADQHFAQAWNYRYSAAYGSAEYSTRHYGYRGHDRLRIASSNVVDGGRTLFVEIPEIQMCNQLHLQLMIDEGRTVDMFATCNRLDRPRDDIPGVGVDDNKELAAHPLELDMLVATKKVDNPWRLPIEGARELRIQAEKNLTYDQSTLLAKPGEALALTLVNPDVVPHNWALVTRGALRSVGEQANRLVADPEALVRQYVPQTNEVLCYTDIVEPSQEFTIYFRAPQEPGRYPYLCTFPGHWMVMNGELVVRE